MGCRWLAPLAALRASVRSPDLSCSRCPRTRTPPPGPAHDRAESSSRRSRPLVDGGAFAAKATVGEPVTVTADVFTDGHDRAAAALRYRFGRKSLARGPDGRPRQRPLRGHVRARPARPLAVPGRRLARPPRHVAARHGAQARRATGDERRRDGGPADRVAASSPRRASTASGARRRGAGRPAGTARGRRHAALSATCRRTTRRTPTGTSRTSRTSSRSTAGPSSWSSCSGGPACATPSPRCAARRPRGRPRAGPVQRVVRVLPPLDAGAGDRARHAGRRPRPPRLRRRHGLRRRLPPARPPDRHDAAQGPQQHRHVVAGRHRQPVGDRRLRRRPHVGAHRAGHDRGRRQAGHRLPRARHGAGARHRLPVHARTTRGSPSTRSGSPTAPTARSSTPRTRRRSTRTSTRSTSRARTGGACGTSWPT